MPTLSVPLEERTSAAVSSVKLYDEGQGIFSIHIAASVNQRQLAKDVIGEVVEALKRVQQEESVKALMVRGIEGCFMDGGREEYNEAVGQGLYETIVTFPYPVIAALAGDVRGAGFLAAALCDLMVCNEEASYGYSEVGGQLYPTAAEIKLLCKRFGSFRAQELLYGARAAMG